MTPAYDLIQPGCHWCHEWPCVCRIRIRTLPCACGGSVTADPTEPTHGVQVHQREAVHRLYRQRMIYGLDLAANISNAD